MIEGALSWFGTKAVQFVLSLSDAIAFPVSLVVGLTGCLLVTIGFRKRGFRLISFGIIVYIMIQIIIIAVEIM